MLLTTRLILIIVVFTGGTALGLFAIERQREAVQEDWLHASLANEWGILWDKIVAGLHQRMQDKVWTLRENDALTLALSQRRQDRVRRVMAELAETVRTRGFAERIEVYGLDGRLWFTSLAALEPSPMVRPDIVGRAVAENRPILGIGNDAARNIVVAMVFPLSRGDRVVGVAGFGIPIAAALAEMGRSTDTQVLLVNRRLRFLDGTARELWDRLAHTGKLDFSQSRQLIPSDGRTYSVVQLPWTADFGTLIAHLAMIRDSTAEAAGQQELTSIYAATVAGLMLLAVAALTWYMRREMAPLTAAVSALEALVRGDRDVPLPDTTRTDEIGRMVNAVRRCRPVLKAHRRTGEARDRQRDRQKRFIRRRMADLASVLDAEGREGLQHDIAAIEQGAAWSGHAGASPVPAGSDGEAPNLMVETFEVLVARLRTHHRQQSLLIAELRTALETREAYRALREELEIVRRIQVAGAPAAFAGVPDLTIRGHLDPRARVGGDFYDVFALDADRVGLAVGEVAADGIPAAFFMTHCRALLRATAPHAECPARCLAEVDRLLGAANPEGFGVAVFYGIFHRRTGRLRYAKAGQDVQVLVGRSGCAVLPPTGDGPLGAGGGRFRPLETVLAPGDRLLLFADAIAATLGPDGQTYGRERLVARLQQDGDADLGALVDGVMSDVAAFADAGAPTGCRTCLALRYDGPAEALYAVAE